MATYLVKEKTQEKSIIKFTTAAQLLLTWILYQNTDKYYICEASMQLPFSNMTMTRAYRQLLQTQLFKEHKEGRKIYLTTDYNKSELYKKSLHYCKSPVIHKGYVYNDDIDDNVTPSGEFLLSHISMLDTPTIKTYATTKNNRLDLCEELIDTNKQIQIEIWDYDPLIFAKSDKKIDPISLSYTFIAYNDERISTEIENILKETWRKIDERNK